MREADLREKLVARMDRLDQSFPDQPRAEILLTVQIFSAFRALNDTFNDALAAHGLNLTQFVALISLYASQDDMLFPTDLHNAIFSSRTNITRIADELVRKGWVARAACQDDRRRVKLKLTAQGSTLVEKVLPGHWRQIARVWDGFDTADMQRLGQLFDQLLAATQSHAKAADPGKTRV